MTKKSNKTIALVKKVTPVEKALIAIKPTEQDIAKVMIETFTSHRTVTRYLKGQVANQDLGKRMLEIFNGLISERNAPVRA